MLQSTFCGAHCLFPLPIPNAIRSQNMPPTLAVRGGAEKALLPAGYPLAHDEVVGEGFSSPSRSEGGGGSLAPAGLVVTAPPPLRPYSSPVGRARQSLTAYPFVEIEYLLQQNLPVARMLPRRALSMREEVVVAQDHADVI